MMLAWSAALALAGIVAACDVAGRDAAAGGGDAPAEASTPVIASSASSVSASAGESLSGPPTGLVPPAPGEAQLVGVVEQHLPAGGYTYLYVALERGEPRWVVTMRRDVGTGDRVRVASFGTRHDFYSRRLDRRFAELVFGTVEIVG